MDVKTTDSDSSISLDTTWFVLDEYEVSKKDRGDTSSLPEKNIDDSLDTEINVVNENNIIQEELPADENIDTSEKDNFTNDIELEDIANNQEQIDKLEAGQLVPLTDDELREIKNITDGRRFRNLNDTHMVAYDFDVSYVAELLLLLAKISIGSFFISFCILSLIFLTHSSWEYLDNNSTHCQELAAQHYTILHTNNTWYNTYYPGIDEEEMILKHCPNKFKQGLFKGKPKSSKKYSERRFKHFMRPYIFDKIYKKKNNTSNQSTFNGPPNENEYYEKMVEELEEKYNNLKDEYFDQKIQYSTLKNNCELKNSMNKQCIKLMLKEIIELNRALKCKVEQNIKKDPKKLDKISVAHLDSNLWYLMNSDINDKQKYERLGRARLQHALDADPFISNLNIPKSDQDRSITLMEKKIRDMNEENNDIANGIKEKQKELFQLTHDITSSIRFLEYKKVVLHFFENRLKVLKGMSATEISNTTNNNTSLIATNIPLNLLDAKNQKSMGESMLVEIINDTVSKQNKNVCLCEMEEDGFSEESLNETMQLEKKRIELDNLISSRLNKLQTESNEPFRKLAYIAKWDDKTIWISRKLNDKEHARLIHIYPKCNPAKGWIKNKKFTH